MFGKKHIEKMDHDESYLDETPKEQSVKQDEQHEEAQPVSYSGDEVNASIKLIAHHVKQQTDEIKKKTLSRSYVDEEIANLRKDLIPMIDKVETKINEMKHQSTEDLEKKIERLEMRLNDLQHMKARHGELEKKMTELHSSIGKRAVQGTIDDKELVEAHVRRIEDLEKKIENMNKIMMKGGQGIVLSKLRDDMKNEMDEMRREMSARMKMQQEGPATIDDASLKNVRREMLTEVNNLRAELEDTRNGMNKMVMSAPTMDNKGKVRMEGRDYKDLYAEIRDLRKTVDEENATRIALDKKLTDLSMDVRSISSSFSKIKNLEKLDYDKILAGYEKEKNVDEEINKKLRTEIMKVVGQQLADFSKVMDKKIPNLVTKDDIAKMEAMVRAKKTVVATGLPVDRRIDTLEKRIDELVQAFRGLQSPFVLE